MASTLALPAAAGPVVGLAGHNGRYLGGSFTFTAAGRIRLWSGPIANPTAPAGAPAPQALLDEIDATAAGSFSGNVAGSDPMNGPQYVNGIYMELVSGVAPEGYVRIAGPHS